MIPCIVRRAVVLTGVAAVMSLIVPSTTAEADPICVGVTITGTVSGNRQIGPYCQPYPFAVLCTTPGAGVRPHAEVVVYACVPW